MSAHTPARCEETYRADWRVPYPSTCQPEHTWPLLQSMLVINFSWDRFIWTLTELLRLLRERPAVFHYLYVVRMLRARAAYLACRGPFAWSTPAQIRTGIAAGRVEFVSIYIRLFIRYLEGALREGFGKGRDELFRVVLGDMEEEYLCILEACCFDAESGRVIEGVDVKSWASGTEPRANGKRVNVIPEAVKVPVQMEPLRSKRRVSPARSECIEQLGMRVQRYWFEERTGRTIATDIELERLCTLPRLGGYHLVRYGDEWFEYYDTETNIEKRILYVLCSDRMLRVEQADGMRPGSHPTEIEQLYLDKRNKSTYLVHFDNGEVGLFNVSFRAHTMIDRNRLPSAARGMRSCAGCVYRTLPQGLQPPSTAIPPKQLPARLNDVVGPYCPLNGSSTSACGGGAARAEPLDLEAPRNEGANGVVAGDQVEGQPGEAARDVGVTVTGDFKILRVGDVVIDLSRKHKARAFLRFVHGQLEGGGDRDFYAEEMREAFNAQFPSTNAKRRWVSDRLREDLFKGMERHFDLIVETIDKASGHFRLKF